MFGSSKKHLKVNKIKTMSYTPTFVILYGIDLQNFEQTTETVVTKSRYNINTGVLEKTWEEKQ